MARNTERSFPFPNVPPNWNDNSRQFALGLRNLIEQIQAKGWQRAYPVGSVYLTTKTERPFTFGKWETISTGITGVNGWKRVE